MQEVVTDANHNRNKMSILWMGNRRRTPMNDDQINRQEAIDVLNVGAELLRRVLDDGYCWC